MMNAFHILACSTCRVTMLEGGGDAAGWSIFALLMIILPVLGGIAFFMFRIARRESQFLDPELMDDPVPADNTSRGSISDISHANPFMSPSKLFGIPDNYSAHGSQVDHLIDVVHWFMIALFVGWTLFFLYCLVRFWRKNNPKACYHGVRGHLSSHLEVGVIIIEAVLLLGFAFPLWAERVDSWKEVQNLNPVRVRVVGWQFGWTYHYPGQDGKFGRVDAALMKGVGDIGLDLQDPNAHDDFVQPILKLPKDRPAVLNITSTDVIHNYHIIPMRIQQDAIPGREIPMWFTPIKTIETFVVCGQLCGEGHGNMLGSMEVVESADFDTWAKDQSAAELAKHRK